MNDGIIDISNEIVGGEVFRRRITTFHLGRSVKATTLFHGSEGISIGGCRFVERDDPNFHQLAATMTKKCALAGIPASGQKTLLVAPPSVVRDEDAKIEILAEHIRAAVTREPNGIWGPDANVDEAVMDGVADLELGKHVCGLSESHGELGIDRNSFTAHGIHEAIRYCIDDGVVQIRTASVQGAGAVGMAVANLVCDDGIDIVAVSNHRGTISAERGLPMSELLNAWCVGGDDAVMRYAANNALDVTENPNDLFGHHADLFIPASPLIHSIVHEAETRDFRFVTAAQSLLKIGVRIVAEGANNPLSPAAERYLENYGVTVLPDFVVNAGGVIGCWDGWAGRNIGARSLSVEEGQRSVRQRVVAALRELGVDAGIRTRAEILPANRIRMRHGSICDCEV